MRHFIFTVGVLCCAIGRSSPITFQFTGTISQVPVDEVFGDITQGQPIAGDFTFESMSPDIVPGDPSIGIYQAPAGPPYAFNVNFAGHAFSASDSLGVAVFNASVDQYSVMATNALLSETLEIFLQDNTGTVFANDSLPLSPPALSAFASSPVAFFLDATLGAGEVQVNGTIDSLTSVPEPSSAALLAGALAWCAVRTARIRSGKRRRTE